MLLFSIFVVIVGLFETSAAFYSFSGGPDVFHLHPTPQSMWTASFGTALNRDKFFPPSCQLWNRNKFGAVSINESSSEEGHTNIYACWEENAERDCLGTCKSVIRGGVCPEDERLDEFSNVVTNSGEALIGGTCTGGLIVMCVVIYFLYKLLKDDSSVHPTTGHVPQPDAATSSPPPAYNEVSAIEECADLSCA
ncbi:uncharacterized protein LOC110066548 isoform X3 [Orbicella faveolata]|uniref:uncharacterized protein LOC110066548 isoform X3 n=1 Tax=Orbicella faveolata TaxID=48498 RepID=UPI0009E44AAA|nr:uncharacterized protein LOC110066548 isoform X3 [Orbicella faveolata]